MKKTTSSILAAALIFSTGLTAFAADVMIPEDVKGTKYEAAVTTLVEKEILSGYPDGTYRPAGTINRAEACTAVVKAMDPTGATLYNAKDGIFTDMTAFSWAEKYVNHAVSKGVVSGYGNNVFKPQNPVTYNEMATMLVNAMGYRADQLGTEIWPANYVNKATELGIFTDITVTDKGAAATRGDVALMLSVAADQISEVNKEEAAKPTDKPSTEDGINNGTMSDYTGRAYGVILSTSKVTNSEGDKVEQIEFLMGDKIYYFNTDGKAELPAKSDYLKGNLYCLKMNKGIVKRVSTDGTALGSKRFYEFTTTGALETVEVREKTEVKTEEGQTFNIMDDAIFYVLEFDGKNAKGYKPARLNDIKAGDQIRAFDVTNDDADLVDIVVIVKANDISKL